MWLPPMAAVLLAAAIVLVPGLVIGALLGLRGLRLAAVAPVIGVFLIGTVGAVGGQVGFAFNWLPILIAMVIAGGAAWIVARSRRDRRPTRPLGPVAPIVGGAVGAAALAIEWARSLGQPGSIDLTYDGVFHLNAVDYILRTGDASSFHLYRVSHPGTGLEFYPSGWHSIVALVAQLGGIDVPTATNASWLAIAIAVWIPGAMLLADVAVGGRARRRILVAAAGAVSGLWTAFPLLLLDWGTLYPTFVAYALVPAGLALAIEVIPIGFRLRMGMWPGSPTHRPLVAWLLLVVWLGAATFAHPRSIFTWAVLVLPLAIAVVAYTTRRYWPSPRARRRIIAVLVACGAAFLAVVVAGGAYVYLTFGLSARPIADHLNGGPATAHQGVLPSVLQVLLQSPIGSPTEQAITPSIGIAVGVLAGIVLAVRHRGTRWLVVAYLIVAALAVLAAGSNSDLAKVATALWYKDKYRLVSALPLVGVPLVAFAIERGATLVPRALPRAGRVVALRWTVAGLAIAAVAALAVPGMGNLGALVADARRIPAHVKHGALVSQDDLALLRRLPQHLAPGDLLLGNPWNGSVLSGVIGDRQPVFPHFTGVWNPSRVMVGEQFNRLGLDPQVCASVTELHARWVFVDSQLMWGGGPAADVFASIDVAAANGLLTEVDRQGTARLYRVDGC